MKESSCGILSRKIPTRLTNLQTPRKGSRLTEKLLIKPVAPTTKSLRQNNTWCNCIRKCCIVNLVSATSDPGPQGSYGHRSHNADAAFPNLQESPRIRDIGTKIAARVCNEHMVSTRPNNSSGNSPHCHVIYALTCAANLCPAPSAKP